MLNPVFAADGHTYDRPAIERLIAIHKRETKSPVTGLLLAHHDLEINWEMRRVIINTADKELERTHGRAYMQGMREAFSQLTREQGAARTQDAACWCPEQEQGAATGKCAKD
jgi:hypothetical protein